MLENCIDLKASEKPRDKGRERRFLLRQRLILGRGRCGGNGAAENRYRSDGNGNNALNQKQFHIVLSFFACHFFHIFKDFELLIRVQIVALQHRTASVAVGLRNSVAFQDLLKGERVVVHDGLCKLRKVRDLFDELF